MADSTIRVRQLNQTELSGFVSGVFSSYPKVNVSGSIIPSGSGISDIGSSSFPYSKIYTNQINITSGSGVYFGPSFFKAFNSGGFAYLNIGGITMSSSGDNVYIAGPSGKQGPSGVIGPIGLSGIGVTGVSYNTTTSLLTFKLSNNTSTSFNFEGLSGATGVSLTGFFRSGNYIYPQYDNFKGTGAGIQLVAGPQGNPGGINFFFENGGTEYEPEGLRFPATPRINPYYDSSRAPSISLMRGMVYNVDASGLHTHVITEQDMTLLTGIFSGQSPPFSVEDELNYIETGDCTGYWRIAFFDKDVPTGFYDSVNNPNGLFVENPDNNKNFEVYGNYGFSNLYRTNYSFMANFTALGQYKYGFMGYTIGGDTSLDVDMSTVAGMTGFAYVLGDVYFSSGIGPVGPLGPSGLQGTQGIIGPIGPTGLKGDDGADVVSYSQRTLGPNQYELQFIFSDGNIGEWVSMPSGGPSGIDGPSGLRGGLTNYFSGEYSLSANYSQNDTISSSGSSYVYIYPTPSAGIDPSNTTYWQMLAKKGDIGPTGATGIADRYSVGYSVISGFPTGAGTYANGITGITVNGSSLSGTGARFQSGQVLSFRNSGLVGYSFSPYQSIVLSTTSYTGTYCYGSVLSFNKTSGILSMQTSGGTGIANTTYSGGYFLWYNWGNATVNLGANIVSGATGPQGIQGIQGQPGAASAMRTNVYLLENGHSQILDPTGLNITGGRGIDCFCVTITGNGNQIGSDPTWIDFNWSGVQTGQSLIVKIRNSGITYGNSEPPLFYFSGNGIINSAEKIKWPMGLYSRPNDKEAYIYTILRFPDEDGELSCFGTYSNPYFY
jgi:hypothetical protein